MNDAAKKFEYFCILSGGGIRGVAYIGVFRALERLGVDIKGIAGASVGSIFATLYALGYTIEEMEKIFHNVKYENFKDINLSLSKNFSIWKGDNIFNWITEIVEKKFYGENYEKDANLPVKFKDIEKDLVIITTDISTGSYKEFSKYATPDESIATAVRASISLPGIFKPTWVDENCIIDGDVIRGLPFWSYSQNMSPEDSRILEFRLEGQSKNSIENNIEYITAIVNTASNISTEFIMNKYSRNDRYDYIKINTENTVPVDFSIKKEKILELSQLGFDATIKYFKQPLREKKTKLICLYQEMLKEFQSLREFIKKQKSAEFKLSLNKTLLLIIKNKDLLEEKFYNECVGLFEEILENTTISNFFKKTVLKNRDKFINDLEKMVFSVTNKQLELKEQMAVIGCLIDV